MSFRFVPAVSLETLASFEQEYEPELQETEETLKYLSLHGRNMCLYEGEQPLAVTTGIAVARMQPICDDFKDIERWNDAKFNTTVLYMYSTTVFKRFQGAGYGKLLCAYYAGFMKGLGFRHLIGHATSDSMRSIRVWMGAEFGAEHANWCGSTRTARFYNVTI